MTAAGEWAAQQRVRAIASERRRGGEPRAVLLLAGETFDLQFGRIEEPELEDCGFLVA